MSQPTISAEPPLPPQRSTSPLHRLKAPKEIDKKTQAVSKGGPSPLSVVHLPTPLPRGSSSPGLDESAAAELAAASKLEGSEHPEWKIGTKKGPLHDLVQESLHQAEPYSPKPSLTGLSSPPPPSTPSPQVRPSEEPEMFGKADLLMTFFSNFPEGITLSIGQQQYVAKPKRHGEGLCFFNDQGEKVGETAKDQPEGEDLRLVMNCLQAYVEKVSLMSELHDSLCRAMVDPLFDPAQKKAARQTVLNIVNHWAAEPSWKHYVVGEGVPVPRIPEKRVWEQPAKGRPERIPGFKARGPGDEAWFSLKLLGAGGYVGVKQMIRIPPFPDTNITIYEEEGKAGWVRYTKAPFKPHNPKSVLVRMGQFEEDMKHKLEIQKHLRTKADTLDPKLQEYKKFVAEIIETPAYAVTDEEGSSRVKTRYISEQVRTDLNSLLYPENEDEEELNRQRPLALQAFYDGVRGVRYLHECGIVHRDIKPGNIFLLSERPSTDDKTTVGRIADFGFAAQVEEKAHLKGTPAYMAPELLTLNQLERGSSDLYALGVTLTEIIDPISLGYELCESGEARLMGREDDNGVRQPVGPREQEMEIKQIQQLLRAKKNPLCDLAADLIDFDPKSRPPIAEVEQRLSVLLQEPERSRILQELSAGSPTP